MKNAVFLAHWSVAFVEEQFYAFFRQLQSVSLLNVIYFCQWNNRNAVEYLVKSLFEQNNGTVPNYENFPSFDCNNEEHALQGLRQDDTMFIVQFNPSHLKHFLKATGQRFPKHYIWWQIEQASNVEFFKDPVYAETIAKAEFVCDFSRLQSLHRDSLHRPFSKDSQLLLYDKDTDRDRISCIAQHQSLRLKQDNPRFAKQSTPTPRANSVLLLGTCEVLRRKFFLQLCTQKGIHVLHPNSFNYLFALERQEFIQNFVNYCHSNGRLAIAVNVHQYDDSVLEKAKIFLLLANNCDIVLSEHSHSSVEDNVTASATNQRLQFCSSLPSMVDQIKILLDKPYQSKIHLPLQDAAFVKEKIVKIAEKISTIKKIQDESIN